MLMGLAPSPPQNQELSNFCALAETVPSINNAVPFILCLGVRVSPFSGPSSVVLISVTPLRRPLNRTGVLRFLAVPLHCETRHGGITFAFNELNLDSSDWALQGDQVCPSASSLLLAAPAILSGCHFLVTYSVFLN